MSAKKKLIYSILVGIALSVLLIVLIAVCLHYANSKNTNSDNSEHEQTRIEYLTQQFKEESLLDNMR